VDDDGDVDVDDLIAVILQWGNCSAPPSLPALGGTCVNLPPCTTPVSHCPADIEPYHKGNNEVNVDDLITVILTWGCSWSSAGSTEDAPQTVQECWEKCAASYPVNTPEFDDCYEKCIISLYEQGLLP
jgi:hypothetical protein